MFITHQIHGSFPFTCQKRPYNISSLFIQRKISWRIWNFLTSHFRCNTHASDYYRLSWKGLVCRSSKSCQTTSGCWSLPQQKWRLYNGSPQPVSLFQEEIFQPSDKFTISVREQKGEVPINRNSGRLQWIIIEKNVDESFVMKGTVIFGNSCCVLQKHESLGSNDWCNYKLRAEEVFR